MYKLLLCWRYLRTRYIALASIVSVTLGVATMIVVNSVMAGFSYEMHQRLHGILSDIVLEAISMDGVNNPQELETEIRRIVGPDLAGLTHVVHVPAMLNFQVRGEWITRQVNLIGIDAQTYASVSDYGRYLLHPRNQEQLSFRLPDGGFKTHDVQSGAKVRERSQLSNAGWPYRRFRVQTQRERERFMQHFQDESTDADNPGLPVPQEPIAQDPFGIGPGSSPPSDPYAVAGGEEAENVFDPLQEQHTGLILGIALGSVRHKTEKGNVEDFFLCLPGDDVQITFPSAGTPPRAVTDSFTIVDFYESKMSEYDSSFAFVPIEKLQALRGMIDPLTGQAAVTSIQLKLIEGADLNAVRDKLRARFPPQQYPYRIQTWRDMQGPLLAAVQMETTILNILLFLIIAVAGFGILATFFMIVVEKTRDIGILKSLGAPSGGVMSIFLSYGLSLGVVGSGVGLVLGLLFVVKINEIAGALEYFTGREVFDPTVYYFQQIPTIIQPLTISWIVAGAVFIAVMASVLPALRAARLHPVEALRYE